MNRTRLCGSTPAVLLVALLGSWPSCIVEISSEEPAGDRAMTAASGEESAVGDLGSLYSWSEALARGVVDINFNPWETARGYRQIVENITRLSPGIVYRLGFLYGGPTQFFLSKQQELLQELRARLPQAHFNAALPQQITKGYSVTLACPGATSAEKPTTQTFTYSDLTGLDSTSGVQYGWLDFSRTRVKEYYLCLGKIFVAQGFTLIHFEDSAGLASKNSDPKKVWDTLIAVKKALEVFAAAQGKPIYWSGGPELSRRTAIQMVYLPARYYHLTTATQYQNRIARPEVGTSGYSYALSRKRITDAKMSTAPSVAIMFYIDNWDASQDDLRRMMELDRLNRRYLLRESGRVARDNGVYFIPSLNHCAGCIPQQIVGDACQKVLSRDGKFLYTMYDASACDDLDAIRDAMRPPTPASTSPAPANTMVTKVQFINEWAVCSDKIARHGDCIDHCIYHNSLYPDFSQNPLRGLAGGDHAYIEYRIDPSGYCRATRVERAFHIKTRAGFANEWGVCSGDIQERAGCPGGKEQGTSSACIYHSRTSTETSLLDSVGKEVEIVYRKLPWLCAAVQESVTGESH